MENFNNKRFTNRYKNPVVPPRVEYSLTKLGYSLKPVIEAMKKWGEDLKANG